MEAKSQDVYLMKQSEQDRKHREMELRTLRRKLGWAKRWGQWDKVEQLLQQINHLHG